MIVLPDPATNAGALPAGPPTGPEGSNETSHSPNRGRTERTTVENATHRAAALHTARGGYVVPDEDADLRGTDVVDARSGRNQPWITKLLPSLIGFRKLCACEGGGRLEGSTRRFDGYRPSANTQSPSLAQGELLATPTTKQSQLLNTSNYDFQTALRSAFVTDSNGFYNEVHNY
ncbi:hypothetical protein F511_27964 [Dorcoceras hygrometricum]|uniref:Uncharacterized protein n=1 Tax=Dorcoceras hygrometricum TaxID=472368 RepID=A0A2Z7CUJ1_9LAMI|nr:hypothetical protein F511_27964 [Dorcoceras hygrometricum]